MLIHDCARAFTPPQVYHRVLEGLGSESPQGVVRAVIPVLPVVDTVKTVDSAGLVTGTPSRAQYACGADSSGF